MVRMARVVVPNYPHHVILRGNRRQKTFFCEDDIVATLNSYLSSQDSQVLKYGPIA